MSSLNVVAQTAGGACVVSAAGSAVYVSVIKPLANSALELQNNFEKLSDLNSVSLAEKYFIVQLNENTNISGNEPYIQTNNSNEKTKKFKCTFEVNKIKKHDENCEIYKIETSKENNNNNFLLLSDIEKIKKPISKTDLNDKNQYFKIKISFPLEVFLNKQNIHDIEITATSLEDESKNYGKYSLPYFVFGDNVQGKSKSFLVSSTTDMQSQDNETYDCNWSSKEKYDCSIKKIDDSMKQFLLKRYKLNKSDFFYMLTFTSNSFSFEDAFSLNISSKQNKNPSIKQKLKVIGPSINIPKNNTDIQKIILF